MKITSMRQRGAIPSTQVLADVMSTLKRRLSKAGFITGVSLFSRTSIKLGLHMRSFRLDLTIHDRNLRHNPHLPPKLTDTPTWDQRVEFNDIVNAVLNKFKISANVRSGEFVIRKGTQCMTEDDWHNQVPMWSRSNESNGYYVEAIDERAYLAERAERRKQAARAKRAAAKAQYSGRSTDPKHGPLTLIQGE